MPPFWFIVVQARKIPAKIWFLSCNFYIKKDINKERKIKSKIKLKIMCKSQKKGAATFFNVICEQRVKANKNAVVFYKKDVWQKGWIYIQSVISFVSYVHLILKHCSIGNLDGIVYSLASSWYLVTVPMHWIAELTKIISCWKS